MTSEGIVFHTKRESGQKKKEYLNAFILDCKFIQKRWDLVTVLLKDIISRQSR